jgi:hypothetical protein
MRSLIRLKNYSFPLSWMVLLLFHLLRMGATELLQTLLPQALGRRYYLVVAGRVVIA